MAEFQEKIPQHRHCRRCGKAFIGEGQFCTDGCSEISTAETKKKMFKLFGIWMVLVAITIVAIVFLG